MPPVGVGVIGCGNISAIYLKVMPTFDHLRVVGCADMVYARAQQQAATFGIQAMTVEALLADPAIDIVVNLTIPAAHATIARAALEAGKSVYNEKPLALTFEEGRALVSLAEARGLLIGGAPDTFLGAGLQTCRRLIDDGSIGEPIAASAFMLSHGPEAWHPDPAFFYAPGGGPLFDMGPYYLTALVSLMGAVRSVTAMARATFATRTVGSEPHAGERISVTTPTHIAASLAFASGAIATLVTSFDVWSHSLPCLEIFGTEGSLRGPDPNTFGGPVAVRRAGETEWHDQPLVTGYDQNSRGLGVADMAHALRQGGTPRVAGLPLHVLEVMAAILAAADQGRHVTIETQPPRPAPLTIPTSQ